MHRKFCRSASLLLSLALIVALGVPALADHTVTVPAGTVIPLRMDTYLSSDTSRIGDRFTATVFRNVAVDRRVIIPTGAKVEGHITGVERAQRGSKAGTIAVGFDRLVFPNNFSIAVDATLTTLNEEARQSIDRESIDQEDRVEGGSRTRRAVVFIGGGAGAGAIIGAAAGGAKGAAVGAGVGAVLGTIGVLLSKGEKAEVRPGTEFGMRIERTFTIATEAVGVAGIRYPYDGDDQYPPSRVSQDTGTHSQTVFTSPESIRSAQMVLRDRGFYNGPINGVMNAATRNALRNFQRDRNISMSGELDLATARELGIASDTGFEATAVEIINPRAERIDRNSIRITLEAQTRTGGWRVFTDHFVSGDTLHVYVRGSAPRSPSSMRIEHHPVSETIDNAAGVTRVIFHGAQRDITVNLSSFGGGGGFGTSPTSGRQIAFLANRLLMDYQRDLNLRSNRGQVVFDTRRDIREDEVELLFHLYSLEAAANLFNQMINSVTDEAAIRSASDSLIRQARLVVRSMRRNAGLRLSSAVMNDWEQFRAELARINPAAADLESDLDRIR